MAKDNNRIIDLNIEMKKEDCVLPDGKAVTTAEICRNWILRLVRNDINQPHAETGRPTKRADMNQQRAYHKLSAALAGMNDKGQVELTGELWSFANRHVMRSNEVLDDNLAGILVQVLDKVAGAKEVEESQAS